MSTRKKKMMEDGFNDDFGGGNDKKINWTEE